MVTLKTVGTVFDDANISFLPIKNVLNFSLKYVCSANENENSSVLFLHGDTFLVNPCLLPNFKAHLGVEKVKKKNFTCGKVCSLLQPHRYAAFSPGDLSDIASHFQILINYLNAAYLSDPGCLQ